MSYSPYLERGLFAGVVRQYEPDIVLLMVDVTDIGDDLRYENESISATDRP